MNNKILKKLLSQLYYIYIYKFNIIEENSKYSKLNKILHRILSYQSIQTKKWIN